VFAALKARLYIQGQPTDRKTNPIINTQIKRC
jgi:hypothetical protein